MADQGHALVRSQAGGDVTSNQMGEVSIRHSMDVAAAQQVAYAQQNVQARYVMAIQRPRNEELFRSKLMLEVAKPDFAAICEYRRPVGKEQNRNGQWVDKIATGPSIHLLRTALRLFGNNTSEPMLITETAELRVGSITISDYENNFHVVRTFAIEKRVEKRGRQNRQTGAVDPPPGREVLETRINSDGEKVFIVRMNLDELRKEELRQTALAKRAAAEEFLPRHIIRAALLQAVKVTHDADAQDPEGAKNKLIDAFAELKIMATDLTQYLGHPLDRLSNDELGILRSVWTRISNEEATWEDCLAEHNPTGSAEEADKVRAQKLAALSQPAGKAARSPIEGQEHPADPVKVATQDAPPGDKRFITVDQAQEFAQVLHTNNLDDEQIKKLVAAGGADRYDRIKPELYPMVLKMAQSLKGKGAKK